MMTTELRLFQLILSVCHELGITSVRCHKTHWPAFHFGQTHIQLQVDQCWHELAEKLGRLLPVHVWVDCYPETDSLEWRRHYYGNCGATES